ncbi:hypothetical protein AB0J90_04235 [Micromonospora sp. NPDC049523]|uniref:hypothetical protein n=1 Tax=Micromonospora sp. NPDC049523 TaxID=3155921 RepID=UPI0034153B72
MSESSPIRLTYSRSLWPALMQQARNVVAAHEGDRLCDYCIEPGDCGRLRGAQSRLADPEMLAAEQEERS